jgi:hypothetical protein
VPLAIALLLYGVARPIRTFGPSSILYKDKAVLPLLQGNYHLQLTCQRSSTAYI